MILIKNSFSTLILYLSLGFAAYSSTNVSLLSQQVLKMEEDLGRLRKKILATVAVPMPEENPFEASLFLQGKDKVVVPLSKLLEIASRNKEGKLQRVNQYGDHPVYELEGVHYKSATVKNPLNPLREISVYFLHKLLFDKGIPPSLFMVGISSNNEKFIIQASETIKGDSLQDILDRYTSFGEEEKKRHFSSKSLTRIFFHSLVVGTNDAKPDNFIIDHKRNIFSIDNDRSLSSELECSFEGEEPEYINSERGELHNKIRNFFYLMDTILEEKIDIGALEVLKQKPLELFMLEWLASIENCQREYKDLVRQGALDEQEYGRMHFRLTDAKANTLLLKLRLLQDVNTATHVPSLKFLFQQTSPLTYYFYRKLLKREESIQDALNDLYSSFPSSFKVVAQDNEYFPEGRLSEELIKLSKEKWLSLKESPELTAKKLAKRIFSFPSSLYHAAKLQKATPQAFRFLYDFLKFKDIYHTPWELLLSKYALLQEEDNSIKISTTLDAPFQTFYFASSLFDREDSPFLIKRSTNTMDKNFIYVEHASQVFTRLMVGGGALRSLVAYELDIPLLVSQKPRFYQKLFNVKDKEKILSSLEAEHISDLLLSSMIINPTCDEPERFYVEEIKDGETVKYCLTRCDHTLTLGPTLYEKKVEERNKSQCGVYSFLFFLKEMNDVIHPRTLEKIMLFDEQDLLPDRLGFLAKTGIQQSEISKAKALIRKKKINYRIKMEEFFSSFERKIPPIPLHILNHLKTRFCRLQEILWKNTAYDPITCSLSTSLTHWEVFCFLKPEIIKYYDKSKKDKDPISLYREIYPGKEENRRFMEEFLSKESSPLKRLLRIQEHDFCDISEKVHKDQEKILENIVGGFIKKASQEAIKNLIMASDLGVPLTQLLTYASQQDSSLEKHPIKILNIEDVRIDFKNIFRRIPEHIRGSALKLCDFSSVTKEFQEELFLLLKYLKNRSLYFKNAEFLTNHHLKALNMNYLTELHIENCPQISEDFFSMLSGANFLYKLKIVSLGIESLKQSYYWDSEGGEWDTFNTLEPLKLEYLKRIVLKKLPNILPQKSCISAPNLQSLRADVGLRPIVSLKEEATPPTFKENSSFLSLPEIFNLQNTGITDNSLRHIGLILEKQQNVRVLNLSDNFIGDQGAQIVGDLLKNLQNSHKEHALQEINLTHNNIGHKKGQALFKIYKEFIEVRKRPLLLLLDFNRLSPRLIIEFYKIMVINVVKWVLSSPNNNKSLLEKLPLSPLVKEKLAHIRNEPPILSVSEQNLNVFDIQALKTVYGRKEYKKTYPLQELDVGKASFLPKYFKDLRCILNTQTELVYLYLNDHHFTKEQWTSLLSILGERRALKRLGLARTSFPQEKLKDLTSCVSGMKDLKFLGLAGNEFQDVCMISASERSFYEDFLLLTSHPSLEVVDFRWNSLSSGTVRRLLEGFKNLVVQRPFPIFLLTDNHFPPKEVQEIYAHFSSGIIKQAFSQKDSSTLLNFLVCLDIFKETQDYIKSLYEDADGTIRPNPRTNIGLPALSALVEVIHYRPIIKLILNGCGIDDRTLGILREKLGNITTLRKLSLYNNFLSDESVSHVIGIVSNNKNLEKLNIGRNKLTLYGQTQFLEILRKNSNLKSLCMERNLKNNEAVLQFNKAILESLTSSQSLLTLKIDEAHLTDQSKKEIKEHQYNHIKKTLKAMQKESVAGDVINLFKKLGRSPGEIAEFFGLTKKAVKEIANPERMNYVKGHTFLEALEKKTPRDLEKKFLKCKDFFIIRYGFTKKNYKKMENTDNICFILLSQPVCNPYYGLKEGLEFFKRDFYESIQKNAYWLNLESSDFMVQSIQKKLKIPPLEASALEFLSYVALYPWDYNEILSTHLPLYLITYIESTNEVGDALYYLGNLYLKGEEFRKDPKKAFEYLEKASKKNHKESFYQLALMYKKGVGCLADKRKYLALFKEAATLEHCQAQFTLGKYLLKKAAGRNIPVLKKIQEGLNHLKSSSSQGHIKSKMYLDAFYKIYLTDFYPLTLPPREPLISSTLKKFIPGFEKDQENIRVFIQNLLLSLDPEVKLDLDQIELEDSFYSGRPELLSILNKIAEILKIQQGFTQAGIISVLAPDIRVGTNATNILRSLLKGTRQYYSPEKCLQNYLKWLCSVNRHVN